MKDKSQGNGPPKTEPEKRTKPKPVKKATSKPAKLGQNGSREANQRAAIVLEVLAGVRTPGQAAVALNKSVNYYYVIERKALKGLLAACQPQPKGRSAPGPVVQIERLQRQLDQCRNQCQRQEALVRATQRAVGLPAVPVEKATSKKKPKGRKRRRRRPTVRALQAVEELQQNSSLETLAAGVEQTVSTGSQTTSSNTEN
jgi:hypothetical protein